MKNLASEMRFLLHEWIIPLPIQKWVISLRIQTKALMNQSYGYYSYSRYLLIKTYYSKNFLFS